MIDNFDFVRNAVLDFKEKDDFYVFHILQRAKDKRESHTFVPGDHEDGARLIKTYYVDSLEYLDRKKETMISLANENQARIYMLPQVRSKLVCNREIAKNIVEHIDNPEIRYDHFLRTAICGCHKSRAKKWIIDLDIDLVPEGKSDEERRNDLNNLAAAIMSDLVGWSATTLKSAEYKVFEDNLNIYPTRNGFGILTNPFDQRIFSLNNDLIKKDGMLLVYCGF